MPFIPRCISFKQHITSDRDGSELELGQLMISEVDLLSLGFAHEGVAGVSDLLLSLISN